MNLGRFRPNSPVILEGRQRFVRHTCAGAIAFGLDLRHVVLWRLGSVFLHGVSKAFVCGLSRVVLCRVSGR